MRIDVNHFTKTQAELRFLETRRNELNLIREELENSFSTLVEDKLLSKPNDLIRSHDIMYLLLEMALNIANSMSDILVRLVYFEFCSSDFELKEKDITISKIKKNLVEDHPLSKSLTKYSQSECSTYIRSAVNVLKHRSLIKRKTRLDHTGFYGPVLDDFVYDDYKSASKTWIEVFEYIDQQYTNLLCVIEAANNKNNSS